MIKWQLLAILALHYCLAFVQRIQRDVVQISERVEHEARPPLDREIGHVLDGIIVLAEDVRFELGIGFTHEFRETLVPT